MNNNFIANLLIVYIKKDNTNQFDSLLCGWTQYFMLVKLLWIVLLINLINLLF
jgi:hypothetical protein